MEQDDLCDVTFLVEDELIHGHLIVLTSGCPVLFTLFTHPEVSTLKSQTKKWGGGIKNLAWNERKCYFNLYFSNFYENIKELTKRPLVHFEKNRVMSKMCNRLR